MRSTVCLFLLIFAAGSAQLSCGASIPDPQPLPAGIDLAGEWDSNWGKTNLLHKGKHVHGTYQGYRTGSISGDLDGNLLKFKWTQMAPRMWGRGYLQISADGKTMLGTWGYQKNHSNGGHWKITRD